MVDKHLQEPMPDMPSAGYGALAQLERSAVVAALQKLSGRQREAIVLRYYADLSEAEVAALMGISCSAVKSHTARGIAALRAELAQQGARRLDGLPPLIECHAGFVFGTRSVMRATSITLASQATRWSWPLTSHLRGHRGSLRVAVAAALGVAPANPAACPARCTGTGQTKLPVQESSRKRATGIGRWIEA
jgi:hypothetical protein